MNKDFWAAVTMMSGTIIGAGIFSLPFMFRSLGFGTGLIFLAGFTGVYFCIHLAYARILEKQRGEHQFFYLAKKYLSPFFASTASLVILGELLLVLTVYLILAPSFFSYVFPELPGSFAFFLFWAISSIFIFGGLKLISFAESFDTIGILVVVFMFIFLAGTAKFVTPLFEQITPALFFLPFGPLLFSLSGRPALSRVLTLYNEAREHGKGFSLTSAVFWGTAIPAILYGLFAFSVLRLNPLISPDTISSLHFLSSPYALALGVLGFLALWTSYFMIGINVRDIFRIDLKFPTWASVAIVVFAPLLVYFLGVKQFLMAVSFTGGVFLALEAVFVLWIWSRVFPNSLWRRFMFVLYVVFGGGLVYEVLKIVRII